MSRSDLHRKYPSACLHAVGRDASSTRTLLLSLSTIAGTKISNPPWGNFQSAGWVSFQSAPTPEAILQRFKQFLAPGGRCFVAVPNGESLHRRFGHAAGLLDDMMALGAGDLELGHERLYSVTSLSAELENCGYSVLRKEGIFLKPMTTNQLLSLQLTPEIIQAMCEVGIGYPELSCGLLFEVQAVGS